MTIPNLVEEAHRSPELIRTVGGWSVAIGVGLVILGLITIMEPAVAGLATALLVGWLLVLAGMFHLVGASSGGGAGRVLWQMTLGIASAVGGLYLVTHPRLGLDTLTLVLAAVLATEAVLEACAYFQLRTEGGGSGWVFFNALITTMLAVMIWKSWPSSSAWAIGTLVGANLLTTGISRVMLGLATRELASQLMA